MTIEWQTYATANTVAKQITDEMFVDLVCQWCALYEKDTNKNFANIIIFEGDVKEKGRTSNDVLTNLPNKIILSISATETEYFHR